MSQPGIIQINFAPKTKNTKREPPTQQPTKNQSLTPKPHEKQTGKNEKNRMAFTNCQLKKNCQL
jgi:hypothetical protein